LTLLRYVRQLACRGDAISVMNAIEKFAHDVQWLKVAGECKARVLAELVVSSKPSLCVELGTYCCAYSAISMAQRMKTWGGLVVPIEVDAIHACIARFIVKFAGLSDHVEILVGRGHDRIDDLVKRFGTKSVDMLFLDHRMTIFHIDLERVKAKHLLKESAIVIADNVLCPGAPKFLWYLSKTSVAAWFRTLILEVMEFGLPYQDWIVVCRLITQEGEEVTASVTSKERPPPKLRNLACMVDRFMLGCAGEDFEVATPRQFHKEQVECRLKEIGLFPRQLYTLESKWTQCLFDDCS